MEGRSDKAKASLEALYGRQRELDQELADAKDKVSDQYWTAVLGMEAKTEPEVGEPTGQSEEMLDHGDNLTNEQRGILRQLLGPTRADKRRKVASSPTASLGCWMLRKCPWTGHRLKQLPLPLLLAFSLPWLLREALGALPAASLGDLDRKRGGLEPTVHNEATETGVNFPSFVNPGSFATIQLKTANVTNYNAAVDSWLDVMAWSSIFKKTHLDEEQTQQKQKVPSVKDTIKDLGVDNSLARKRHLKTHSTRLSRGGRRLQMIKKLLAQARRKYVSMSAAPAALWGHMALGVPPNKLKAWRLSVARTQHWVGSRMSCHCYGL